MNDADLPVRLHLNGVQILGQYYGGMDIGRLKVPAGGDTTPLLEGLPDDLCQCPHWGLLLSGTAQVRFHDGHEETVEAGQIFYWPPAHTVWTINGFESIQISPEAAMQHTLDHIQDKLATSASSHR